MQAKSFSARERAARRPENCIRAWRKHRGLTLERLAAILTAADHDIDAQRLSKLETRLIPLNHQEIALLAQALKCSETELLRLPPGSGALELTAEGTEHEISEGAAKVDLGFIALQLDRVHEMADFRNA